MEVRFWGVRGSIPVSDPNMAGYGGNTSCIEVRCGEHLLVLDAGSGIRKLGKEILQRGLEEIDLFLTHTHLDHVVGLPFFPFAYVPDKRLKIWSGHLPDGMTTRDGIARLMQPPLLPIEPDIFIAEVSYETFHAGETLTPKPSVTLRTAPLVHPDGATGYRIEYDGRAVCYITDTEHDPAALDANILKLIRDADIVIYDSMFTDAEYPSYKGWGHSTWEEALRLCREANVRIPVIFHHLPERNDAALDEIAAAAEAMFPGSVVAREGMTLTP